MLVIVSLTRPCLKISTSSPSSSPPSQKNNVKRGVVGIRINAGRFEQHKLNFVEKFAPSILAAILAFSPFFNPPGFSIEDIQYLMNDAWQYATEAILPASFLSFGLTLDERRGATLFNRACIGCHVGGGNIIQPGATLFLKDLQRNGVDTEDEIYRVTYSGKGRMPGFGEKCTPRGQCTFGARLQEDEIKLLAEFVKSQADQDWPTIENIGD